MIPALNVTVSFVQLRTNDMPQRLKVESLKAEALKNRLKYGSD